MTEQQKALSLVNMLRIDAPRADMVPPSIRTAYAALLDAYEGLSDGEKARVFYRARYDAAPADRRDIDLGDPDLLVEAHYAPTMAARVAATKAFEAALKAARLAATEIGGSL